MKVRDSSWNDVPDPVFMVWHPRFEGKGTDANVAARLVKNSAEG